MCVSLQEYSLLIHLTTTLPLKTTITHLLLSSEWEEYSFKEWLMHGDKDQSVE